MLVAGAAEALEEGLRGREDAALALEGLDEDGAGLALGEDGLCGGEVEVGDGVDLRRVFDFFLIPVSLSFHTGDETIGKLKNLKNSKKKKKALLTPGMIGSNGVLYWTLYVSARAPRVLPWKQLSNESSL